MDWKIEAIGWAATAILIATLVRQVWTQARTPHLEGVSRWLFAGQLATSALFLAYSALVGNGVFVVSNAALVLVALAGLVIDRRKRAAGHAAEAVVR